MKSILRFLIVFLAITGAVVLMTGLLGVEFGNADFWNHHGLFFLIFIALFPRLTLLFSSVPFGGLFWWMGFIFAPRILVAVLATLAYWRQNPLLVVFAWLAAVGGESSEKYVVVRRGRGRSAGGGQRGGKGFESAKWVKTED